MADRIIAQPSNKAYGRLSVLSQFYCAVEHGFDISPQAFVPPPKVMSTVLTFTPRTPPADVDPHLLEKNHRSRLWPTTQNAAREPEKHWALRQNLY